MKAHQFMPVLTAIENFFNSCYPFDRWNIIIHMHLTKEIVKLGKCLRSGGAEICYWPSNRNPSPNSIVELAKQDGCLIVNSIEDLETYVNHASNRFMAIEGNGQIFTIVHDTFSTSPLANAVKGISMHTSGGGNKVDSYDPLSIRVPVVAVYREPLKHLLETGLGTSQSTISALLRGLKSHVAGRQILIIGYGRVGCGLARSLTAMGACVAVSDIDQEKCLMAQLAGFRVVSKEQGISRADLCITATGCPSILDVQILEECRNGLLIANVSNMPMEIDTRHCKKYGKLGFEHTLWKTPKGKRFEILGGGLQINHVLGSGNPPHLMDLSLSLHAMVIHWLISEKQAKKVIPVPAHIRNTVASYFFSKN